MVVVVVVVVVVDVLERPVRRGLRVMGTVSGGGSVVASGIIEPMLVAFFQRFLAGS